MQKILAAPFFDNFRFFYKYSGIRLFIILFVTLLSSVSESFGLMMVLPLLNIESSTAAEATGFTKTIYDTISMLGMEPVLTNILILLFLFFLLKSIFVFAQQVLMAYLYSSVEADIRLRFCIQYKNMSYKTYMRNDAGYFTNIITTETKKAVGALNYFIEVLSNLIFLFVYLCASFAINAEVSLITLLVGGITYLLLKTITKKAKLYSIKYSESNAKVESSLLQYIINFKYIKATNIFSPLLSKIKRQIEENRRYYFKTGAISALPVSVFEPVIILLLACLIMYFTQVKGEKVSDVFILLMFFYKLFSRIRGVHVQWVKFNASAGGVEMLKRTTALLTENEETVGAKCVSTFENLELKDITFSYGKNKILDNFSLNITKNSSVAIVGRSGAGKTTLVDIITGLLKPESGVILLNGINFNDVDTLSYRSLIGYVTQNPVVFNDDVTGNIAMNDEETEVHENKLENALKDSNSKEFIKEMEDSYRTMLGDFGVRLSGGQKQRIAIAREFYKEPELLLFDEATSSLDSESESYIQQSVDSMMGKTTMLIIAHRLSTVKKCDVIYVMDKGRIVESGSFDELYNNRASHFFDMCKKQEL